MPDELAKNLPELSRKATQNVSDILQHSIKFDSTINKALVVFDTQNELTNILTSAYKTALPDAQFVDFETVSKDEIIALFDSLSPQDLVVMVQTSSFRLDEFRIRIHLFNKKLKVIEHVHLYRNPPETWEIYINSLSYDPNWYGVMGPKLQQKLGNCENLRIKTRNGDQTCEVMVHGGVEIPKLNTGDYTNMPNIGGTFPIGEVFTEAKDLSTMNGSFWVYAFADTKFEIMLPEIFRVDIKEGLVVGWSDNAPQEFIFVVQNVAALERPIIREIGFGLNRAMSKSLVLGDITAFERIVGVHLSMGEKHSVYKKEGISSHKARFHVDLFLQTDTVTVDNEIIFENDSYVIQPCSPSSILLQ